MSFNIGARKVVAKFAGEYEVNTLDPERIVARFSAINRTNTRLSLSAPLRHATGLVFQYDA